MVLKLAHWLNHVWESRFFMFSIDFNLWLLPCGYKVAAAAPNSPSWHRMRSEEESRKWSFSPTTCLLSGKNIFPRITCHPQTNHWQKGTRQPLLTSIMSLLGIWSFLLPLFFFLSMSTTLLLAPNWSLGDTLFFGLLSKSRENVFHPLSFTPSVGPKTNCVFPVT